MMKEQMLTLAKEAGFEAGFAETADFQYDPATRVFCEENKCGNYNNNYACPPYCGTVEEMKAKCDKYTHALVIKSNWPDVDVMDGPAMKPLKKQHNQKSRKLFNAIKKETGLTSDNTLMIMAGPCGLCPECGMPTGKPCPMPQEVASCLSAYSILVNPLADSAGLTCSWSMDTASFFSLLLFND